MAERIQSRRIVTGPQLLRTTLWSEQPEVPSEELQQMSAEDRRSYAPAVAFWSVLFFLYKLVSRLYQFFAESYCQYIEMRDHQNAAKVSEPDGLELLQEFYAEEMTRDRYMADLRNAPLTPTRNEVERMFKAAEQMSKRKSWAQYYGTRSSEPPEPQEEPTEEEIEAAQAEQEEQMKDDLMYIAYWENQEVADVPIRHPVEVQ